MNFRLTQICQSINTIFDASIILVSIYRSLKYGNKHVFSKISIFVENKNDFKVNLCMATQEVNSRCPLTLFISLRSTSQTQHSKMQQVVKKKNVFCGVKDPWLRLPSLGRLSASPQMYSTGQVLEVNYAYFPCTQDIFNFQILTPISLIVSLTACSPRALHTERQDWETYSKFLRVDCLNSSSCHDG